LTKPPELPVPPVLPTAVITVNESPGSGVLMMIAPEPLLVNPFRP
jgi:hypothetical protein